MQSISVFRSTFKRERFLTLAGLIITSSVFAVFLYLNASRSIELYTMQQTKASIETIMFTLISAFLIHSIFIYLLTRYGRLKHEKDFIEESQVSLVQFAFGTKASPSLTILVPAFKEEISVITMTLLLCVFQEYSQKRIVLLLDNPPDPVSQSDKRLLAESRNLPQYISAMLQPMYSTVTERWEQFESEKHRSSIADAEQVLRALYRDVATWFQNLSREHPVHDHIERYFVEEILVKLASKCNAQADYYNYKAQKHDVSINDIEYGYRYLQSLFSAELVSFERKTFENLSHESNKAMNINSYLGLFGKTFSITHTNDTRDKQFLIPDAAGTFFVPSTDYVINLDADSILATDYALRLIAYLEKPEHQRVAVIQTPYKAFPKAPSLLEHVAGATSDIQYLIHQGFTAYNATFWVGANALLRMKALKDIEMVRYERGYPILRYIQDRTVIEDTESTIELICKGWELHNYAASLSHSATPTDFSSLLIQRRRWANGGLIIFPKLFRYLLFGNNSLRQRLVGCFIRSYYLLSIALVNFSVLIMLIYPFSCELNMELLMIASIPYLVFYARDLVHLGYTIRDLFPIYAFHLLLLPIHISGVLKSIEQLLFGKKIPFDRTPKIKGRTVAPTHYVIAEVFICVYLAFDCAVDLYHGFYANAIFSAVNSLSFWYTLIYFIGFETLRHDGLCAVLRPMKRLRSEYQNSFLLFAFPNIRVIFPRLKEGSFKKE